MQKMILSLDSAGLPHAWVSIEEAMTYHAKNLVIWSLGEDTSVYLGGLQRNGTRSRLETKSIIAIRGSKVDARSFSRTPVLTNDLLFARDRHLCAYCGERFAAPKLSRDHIMPASKGGSDQWTNVVTACRSCNSRKADRTPQQSGMALLYVPYTPNRHEHFILRNRHILTDQMKFLLGSVPATS